MMNLATYFGEINELNSRAVWYSDEEDDDDDAYDTNEDEFGVRRKTSPKAGLEPPTHGTIRSSVELNFRKVLPDEQKKFTNCLISLSSTVQFKHFKLDESLLYGHFYSYGKVFACPIEGADDEYLLWLLFDSADQHLSGHKVGYFVEKLRESLHDELKLDRSCPILILSSQYSSGESLEYLSNVVVDQSNQSGTPPTTMIEATKLPLRLPFRGCPLMPPSIIRNQFESALFEQLTLSSRAAVIVCLPNPKNFWFDKTKIWPSVPSSIIEHKVSDDSLEKTLIFS